MIFKVGGWVTTLALLTTVGAGCGSSSNGTPSGGGGAGGTAGARVAGATGGAGGAGGQTLYDKYGTAIPKVVDDAVAGVLADCEIAPYFAVVATSGHDSVARLKSCLRLQFTALMGGPATYPGKNDEGDTCIDMTAIHAGLGIPGAVFDKFATDLAGVLATDGVATADVTTIAGAVIGLKSQVVSPSPVEKSACDGGAADGGGSDGAAD